jgi:hypothetical protein
MKPRRARLSQISKLINEKEAMKIMRCSKTTTRARIEEINIPKGLQGLLVKNTNRHCFKDTLENKSTNDARMEC